MFGGKKMYPEMTISIFFYYVKKILSDMAFFHNVIVANTDNREKINQILKDIIFNKK